MDINSESGTLVQMTALLNHSEKSFSNIVLKEDVYNDVSNSRNGVANLPTTFQDIWTIFVNESNDTVRRRWNLNKNNIASNQ